jgi:hypothetical protein
MIAVRWYLRSGLSYRDVEELLFERGVAVDHVTICETPSVNLRVLLGFDQAWGRWSLNGPAARQGVARPAGRG